MLWPKKTKFTTQATFKHSQLSLKFVIDKTIYQFLIDLFLIKNIRRNIAIFAKFLKNIFLYWIHEKASLHQN